MRIAIFNKYARVTGGADLHCLELADGLRERGHDVAFLSTADTRNTDDCGVFIPRTVSNDTRSGIIRSQAVMVGGRALWNSDAAAATRQLLKSLRPDVVHVHKLYPQLSVAPVVVASAQSVPIVQTVHDYEFISASSIDDSGHWRDRDEEKLAYRVLNTMLFSIKQQIHLPRLNSLISVSRSTSNAYSQRGIETVVLPNFTRPSAHDLPSFEDRSGVLFIGRLSEEKGLRHVLELSNYLSGLEILVAGEGPLSNEVRYAAQTDPCLSYLGKLDRSAVAEQLASARLVIMPSLWREPGPLAALEAMAAGTPVIAYDKGGLAEYVADAGAGVIVPPLASSLAQAVKSLYSDRERWCEISQRALIATRQVHTRSRYLDKLEEIYHNVMLEQR